MNRYKNLDIWNRSLGLASELYSVKADFTKEEIYGLTSQIKLNVVSMPSNIAEDAERSLRKILEDF